MTRHLSCDEVRPLLFDYKDGALPLEVRVLLHAHLAVCQECLAEERAEEALSLLLRSSGAAPRRRGRLLKAAAAIGAGILVVALPFIGTASKAHGSITRYDVDEEWSAGAGLVEDLGASSHFVLSAGAYSRIDLREVALLSVTGPAVLELSLVQDSWTVVLLQGQFQAQVMADAQLAVTTTRGRRVLEPGVHEISADAEPSDVRDDPEQDTAPAALFQASLESFYEHGDMSQAEKSLRAILEREDATQDQRAQARFYLSGALGRQKRHAEALAEGARFIANNPEHPSRNYAVFFQGIYHRRLGQEQRAREIWEELVAEAPDAEITKTARKYLAMPGQQGAPPVREQSSVLPGVLPSPSRGPGAYLVLKVALQETNPRDAAFARVAEDIASFHEGTVRDFDGASFERLAQGLEQETPRQVLFVLAPETLDINFHRRVLLLSAGLDEDIFPDFTFGYMTAETADQLVAFWQRTREAHGRPESGRRWVSTAVSDASRVYPGYIPGVAKAAGYEGKSIYWSTVESDANTMAFVDRHLKDLEQADVIGMTGNGDPQGIWLFSDQRNINRTKHWNYDPARVGQLEDEMPRIMASRFASLELDSPVIWSGTCHCAATNRVFVEGDIVSTFGRTDQATVHVLRPSNSICLSLIKAGALAFLAPIAANHGMSVSMEQDHAFIHGADLGETIKSTYDDVFLSARGDLVLDFPREGRPDGHLEAVMQGGGSNRILIGDPALAPFEKVEHPLERVTIVDRSEVGFDVVVEWDEGWHPRAWDIFGTDRSRDWRVKARISLEELVPADRRLEFEADVTATNAQGEPFPYALRHCEPEDFHGRRYLHLQANAPRETVERKAVRVVFTVTYR